MTYPKIWSLIVILSAWPSFAAGAQDSASYRFGDVGNITADPTGLVRDRAHPPAPRYPASLEKNRITGGVVVAYVIDTTGLIDVQSATFLNDPSPEFLSATCAFLPKLRFEPFVVGDQKWRLLLVDMYSFNWLVVDTAKVNSASRMQRQKQEEFATEPIEKATASLERLPHCPR